MTTTAPTTLSAIQAASQSNFNSAQLYSTFDKQYDKKLQLTSLSQCKLALTAINKRYAL
jgi:hypothetical protein